MCDERQLKLIERFVKKLSEPITVFAQGDRFLNLHTGKTGQVVRMRNDEREQMMRTNNPRHYYYSVEYDDGSYESYESGESMDKC